MTEVGMLAVPDWPLAGAVDGALPSRSVTVPR